MEVLFSRVLNMSLTGSIVIAVVLLARLFLKRAPKIYSYALWAVVLFRLLCPLSVTAGLSVLKPLPVTTTPGISTVSYQPIAQSFWDGIDVPTQDPSNLQEVVGPQKLPEEKPSFLLTAMYMFTVVCRAFFPCAGSEDGKLAAEHEVSWRMTVPMTILAAAILLTGIFAQPIVNAALAIAGGIR